MSSWYLIFLRLEHKWQLLTPHGWRKTVEVLKYLCRGHPRLAQWVHITDCLCMCGEVDNMSRLM